MPTKTAQDWIAALDMTPHPEGGYYRETWRGETNAAGRASATAILFLLPSDQSSHWHRVDADEMWFWQAGDPLTLKLSACDDGPEQAITLSANIAAGHALQGIVPAHQWQAAAPAPPEHGAFGYTLVSCVVTPGFDFAGFELAPPGWQPGQAL